jgi:hypothetical protein
MNESILKIGIIVVLIYIICQINSSKANNSETFVDMDTIKQKINETLFGNKREKERFNNIYDVKKKLIDIAESTAKNIHTERFDNVPSSDDRQAQAAQQQAIAQQMAAERKAATDIQVQQIREVAQQQKQIQQQAAAQQAQEDIMNRSQGNSLINANDGQQLNESVQNQIQQVQIEQNLQGQNRGNQSGDIPGASRTSSSASSYKEELAPKHDNKGNIINTCGNDLLTSAELLPSTESSTWSEVTPVNPGGLENKNFLDAGFHLGINTVGQSLRNANRQLRSDPAIPKVEVSPWNRSTIEGDGVRRPLEIGGC